MKRQEYEKFIDPKAFKVVYEEWAAKGKPKGNDTTYKAIWDGVTNAAKACIGALQEKYGSSYRNYDEKVLQTTMLVVKRLISHDEPPDNIVTIAWLPALGVCCGTKARQEDFEDNMLSVNVTAEDSETEYVELLKDRGDYDLYF